MVPGLAMCVFVLGGMFGYLVTWIPDLTDGNWRIWSLIRVIWQFGGAIWVSLTWPGMLGFELRLPPWNLVRNWFRVARYSLPVGFFLCFNPVVDLVRGPVTITATDVRVLRNRSLEIEPTDYRVERKVEVVLGGGQIIRDGSLITAPHAPVWSRLAAPCKTMGSKMEVRFLRAMMAPLEIRCLPGP